MNINDYQTIVFDCDGVILDSNKVKTQAFYDTALTFGENAANRLVKFHVERGGVSRYEKFKWFIESLEPEDLAFNSGEPDLNELLSSYAKEVHKGLRNCQIAEGLAELRNKTESSTWLIVSGGDQSELRELFAERNIAQYFDGGIFGSPDTKEKILKRELDNKNLILPAVFIGDSKYDYTASESINGLDFIFVNKWSEVEDWESFCNFNHIPHLTSIKGLLLSN